MVWGLHGMVRHVGVTEAQVVLTVDPQGIGSPTTHPSCPYASLMIQRLPESSVLERNQG